MKEEKIKTLPEALEEYRRSLPAWDNLDYITELAETVEFDKIEDREDWAFWLRTILVGTVNAISGGEPVRHILILNDPKEEDKAAAWLQHLSPIQLEKYHSHRHFDWTNKDSLPSLAEKMFIQLDNLHAYELSQLGIIKYLLNQETIALRKPYQNPQEYKRTATFIASANPYFTVREHTRRFLPFSPTTITSNKDVDMDKVYSQVFALSDVTRLRNRDNV